jgi:T-complex protein 1 subunit beta
MENGTTGDMAQLGILESFHLKRQVVISAAEAAEMVLRIDNIIRAPPRPRQRDMRTH